MASMDRLVRGDVSGARAHHEFALSCAAGDHLNCPPGAGLRRVAGNVADGVLVANVARDALANGYDLVENGGITVLVLRIEDSDCVYENARLLPHFQDVDETVGASVVAAVADDDQDL